MQQLAKPKPKQVQQRQEWLLPHNELRQAIVAWFNGISGVLGRTILTPVLLLLKVRSDIGLGTAATTNNGTGFGGIL